MAPTTAAREVLFPVGDTWKGQVPRSLPGSLLTCYGASSLRSAIVVALRFRACNWDREHRLQVGNLGASRARLQETSAHAERLSPPAGPQYVCITAKARPHGMLLRQKCPQVQVLARKSTTYRLPWKEDSYRGVHCACISKLNVATAVESHGLLKNLQGLSFSLCTIAQASKMEWDGCSKQDCPVEDFLREGSVHSDGGSAMAKRLATNTGTDGQSSEAARSLTIPNRKTYMCCGEGVHKCRQLTGLHCPGGSSWCVPLHRKQ